MVRMWWLSHVETGAPLHSAQGHGSTAKEDGVYGYVEFVCGGKHKMRMEIGIGA